MSCIRSFSSSSSSSSSSATIIAKGFPSSSSYASCSSSVAWRASMWRAGIRAVVPYFLLLTGRLGVVRCFAAARRGRGAGKMKPETLSTTEEEEDAFYVVRKGDVIGVFKSFSDCQAQVSSSVCDPSVSVYKGHSLKNETEEYLASRGLKNACYTINASDCKEDLFGTLLPCPFQQPATHAPSIKKVLQKISPPKRLKEVEKAGDAPESSDFGTTDVSRKPTKQAKFSADEATVLNHRTCILEFDGASKGNPGKAGAGVIVRSEDGTIVSRLREGLGVVTNNVAEYRALILGLKYAVRTGFKKVIVQGDSLLVCMQVQDKWKTKQQNMINLCKEAKQLKDTFPSFEIRHVEREFNSDADAEANFAVTLPSGEVYEEFAGMG